MKWKKKFFQRENLFTGKDQVDSKTDLIFKH